MGDRTRVACEVMKSVCYDTRLVLFCSDSKSSGLNLAGVSLSLHLLKAGQSLTFHGFRNTISVLNLFSDSLFSFIFCDTADLKQ